MKQAIMIGAGNIGRGFIGAILSRSGYHVTFADVNMTLIDAINAEGRYTVHIQDRNPAAFTITNIDGISSAGPELAEALKTAKLVTTAVGLRILPIVAKPIAAGLAARKNAGNTAPLNIVACENAVRATSQLKNAVYALLDDETKAFADANVGFADCAVDRIVPKMDFAAPLDVAVEEFSEWDVERSGWKGELPQIDGMTIVEDLSAYIERKLFTLNSGHAICAYLGAAAGYAVFWGLSAALEPVAAGFLLLAGSCLLADLVPDEQGWLASAAAGGIYALLGVIFVLRADGGLQAALQLILRLVLLTLSVRMLSSAPANARLRPYAAAVCLLAGLVRVQLPFGVPLAVIPAAAICVLAAAGPEALAVGAACGLVLDLGSVPSPPQTACFCFSLLACRLAAGRKLARAAVFSGMYFLCVLVWGGEHAGWTLGVAAGALLACVLPPLPEHPAAEARAAAPDALDQAADVLLALEARVSPALPEPQTAPALIFDSAASAVCRSCVRQQLCWQERADETYRLLCGCAGTILRQGQAREGDLPPAFCSACIRAEAFREAVNQALRTQQAELLAFRRSEESRQIACALLGHLARFVGAAGRRPKAQGAPRWRLSLGVRAVGLRGDTLCGDAGACFQVGALQYVLLCDGMGTGAGAKADAEEAISLLRAMITAGFAAPEAMALLNELYLLRGDGCFSTIDLLELDLCTAEGVLYKWGAAPSYLKKGGNVKKIGTASPPPGLGVGEEHRAGGVRLSLQRGELLVLTTDGVPEAACEQYLRTCGALSPRELAAGVVACASESEPDDRTAAAVQLEPVSLQPHHITRRARNVSKAGARPHI